MAIGIGMGLQIVVPRWDADALAYIAQVEAADGQPLEPEVKLAMNQFVRRCKGDASPVTGVSNWQAIEFCALLSGAQSLSGALIPLKGSVITNINFVLGDYNKITGLQGNGTNKALLVPGSVGNTILRGSYPHFSVYTTTPYADLNSGGLIAYSRFGRLWQYVKTKQLDGGDNVSLGVSVRGGQNPYGSLYIPEDLSFSGFVGAQRSSDYASDEVRLLLGSENEKSLFYNSQNDTQYTDHQLGIFTVPNNAGTYSNARISFFSAGATVNLIALRSAVNAYMEDIA